MRAGLASMPACIGAVLLALAGCRRAEDSAPQPPAGPSVGYATAQASAADPGAASAPSAADDRAFIVAAATDGLFALQAAQLAVARAAAPPVRTLATTMANDHVNAGNELAQLASVRGIALPAQLPRDLQARLRRLAQANGATFDREYLRQVGIAADEKSIARFEAAGRAGADPQIQAWIDRTLPMLRQHLAEAQKLDAGP